MATRSQSSFQTVKTEGALLPADLLKRVSDGDKEVEGLSPESYHLDPADKINEATNRAWIACRDAWQRFQKQRAELPDSDKGTTLTRERWLLVLFRELGYGRLQTAKAFEIEDKTYALSHGWEASPIHLISFRYDLDTTSHGVFRTSPHGLVQELLNRSDGHLWAFVSNGLQLRILRDNVSFTRPAFVEFDLEAMMEGEVYSDFLLLWLLCHQSRVESEIPEQCWLEKWHQTAKKQGTRVLDRLRDGVQKSIEAFGQGFLAHRSNAALRQKLADGKLSTKDYYQQLLRLVYRLIFLFVAEDRDLLLTPDADAIIRKRFENNYSLTRIRRLSQRRRGTRHSDLWQGLNIVFKLLYKGEPRLGLPALGSMLFSDRTMPDLDECELANDRMLEAVRHLAFTVERNVRRQVDYKNLGSEELGSVYESLLELHPDVNTDAATFELTAVAGSERKTTGSYYTPSSLINCLLDSALDPVVAEALKKPDRERAILDLKVCDPACGSGHFLIAAANRLSHHLATARTGDEEPSPAARRVAFRDVVSHCIYGVDINPMAVELCKVALWLESIDPGKPLSFLDHRILCGNSLIGVTPRLLAEGIPDAAFKPITGDDKAVVSEYKRRNKDERKGQLQLDFGAMPSIKLGNLVQTFANLAAMDDGSLEDVQAKEKRYAELVGSTGYQSARLLADAWCAAFVWKKDKSTDDCITESWFRRIEANPHCLPPWIRDEIARLRDQYQFFHWHLAFPDAFRVPSDDKSPENPQAGWSGGFDVVLGNPPWGAAIRPAFKQLLPFKYEGSSRGVLDTFALFCDLALAISTTGGSMGVVLPDIVLLKNYPLIRKLLLTRSTLVSLVHWGQIFPDVNLDVCTLVAKARPAGSGHEVICIPTVTDNNPGVSHMNRIPQRTFADSKDYRFNLRLVPALVAMLARARSLGPKTAEVFTLREGVHSGNIRKKLFLDYPDGDQCEKLLFGRNEIKPLVVTWRGKYIQLDQSQFDRDAGDYFNLGNPDLHRRQKILVRRTGDYLLAALELNGLFASNNYFLCVPPREMTMPELAYCCAALNSRFATWYFRAIQPRVGKLFAELKITHLSEIPIPFLGDPNHNEWCMRSGVECLSAVEAGWSTDAIQELQARFDAKLTERIAAQYSELAAAIDTEMSNESSSDTC